ncbi:MAG TPA: hypothetical protein VFL57_07205 [Bryobacteraceae bacterium]|nr:hypothetical protein [Bryobacteraceae bacterium]
MKITLGTNEPKKIAILAGLVVVGGVVLWMNSGAGDVPPARPSGPRPAVPLVAPKRPPSTPAEAPARPRPGSRQRQLQEFRPSLKPRKPEERPDPLALDPALRLDLLAKLQQVNVEGAHRSIFEFGTPPAPRPVASEAKKPTVPSPIIDPARPKEDEPPKPPPPPKIPLKFYGFTTAQMQQGKKRAFFVEGDCSSAAADCAVHIVNEGDVVKRQYRIVRIGVNSVVVEDIDHKNQQTLPLEEAPVG